MKWFVVRNGEVVFSGTEEECGEVVGEDMTGELEMYPADARCKKMTTEFFKTLKEAKEFASTFNPKHVMTEVYSLDKPGTVRKFKAEQDDAIAWGRYYANSARAVVVLYR